MVARTRGGYKEAYGAKRTVPNCSHSHPHMHSRTHAYRIRMYCVILQSHPHILLFCQLFKESKKERRQRGEAH